MTVLEISLIAYILYVNIMFFVIGTVSRKTRRYTIVMIFMVLALPIYIGLNGVIDLVKLIKRGRQK